MLIAHMADTHLGMRQYGLVWREEDIYERFHEAIEQAVREGVNAILISGDMFDRARPPIRAIKAAMDALEMARSKGIPVYAVLGEHDIPRVKDEPPQVILRSYVKLLGTSKTPDHDTLLIDGNEYVIAGISHYPSQERYLRSLRERLRMLSTIIKGRKSVLMLHQCLVNYFPFEEGLDVNDIPESFTYVAMGHLHKRVKGRREGTIIAYPGSIEILRIDEIDDWRRDGKGFYIVDLSSDEAVIHEVNLNVTPQALINARYPSHVPAVEEGVKELIKALEPLGRGRKGILHVKILMSADVRADPATQVRNLVRRRYGSQIHVRVSVERIAPGVKESLTAEGVIDEESIISYILSKTPSPASADVISKVASSIVKLKNVLAGVEVGDVESLIESVIQAKELWRSKIRLVDDVHIPPPRRGRRRGGLDEFMR